MKAVARSRRKLQDALAKVALVDSEFLVALANDWAARRRRKSRSVELRNYCFAGARPVLHLLWAGVGCDVLTSWLLLTGVALLRWFLVCH